MSSITDGPGDGTWAVFAERMAAERDEARAQRDAMEAQYWLAWRAPLRAVVVAARAACDAWSADCEEPNALPVHDTMAALRAALDAIQGEP